MTTWADINRQEESIRRLSVCKDCGVEFYPTPDNEKFCTKCNAVYEIEVEDAYMDGEEEWELDKQEQIRSMNKW